MDSRGQRHPRARHPYQPEEQNPHYTNTYSNNYSNYNPNYPYPDQYQGSGYQSGSSDSSDEEPDRGRKSSSRRPQEQASRHDSKALTRSSTQPRDGHGSGRTSGSVSNRRQSYPNSRKSHHSHQNSDSDDSENSSDEKSSDDDSEHNSKSTDSLPGDMSVASSSYNKRPKSKFEQKVDSILDALGLLHIKENPGSKHQLSSPDPEKFMKQKQALQAAVTAAAIEAWRCHSKPGGFNVQKVMRVLVAAVAAGGVDVLVDSHPGHEGMKDIAEAIVGGLATSKALGGKITHRREGGAQGKMIDGFIALAASKMVRPPKQDEVDQKKKDIVKRSRSEGSGNNRRSSRKH